MGIHQLKRVEKNLVKREKIWKRYDEAFSGLPIETPIPTSRNIKHARHLYTILLNINKLKVNRNEFQDALHSENIGSGIHFIALHLHKFYRENLNYKRGIFPNAEFISDRTISLPLSPKLSDQDVNDVISAVKKLCKFYLK